MALSVAQTVTGGPLADARTTRWRGGTETWVKLSRSPPESMRSGVARGVLKPARSVSAQSGQICGLPVGWPFSSTMTTTGPVPVQSTISPVGEVMVRACAIALPVRTSMNDRARAIYRRDCFIASEIGPLMRKAKRQSDAGSLARMPREPQKKTAPPLQVEPFQKVSGQGLGFCRLRFRDLFFHFQNFG